jgi:mycoredoxin
MVTVRTFFGGSCRSFCFEKLLKIPQTNPPIYHGGMTLLVYTAAWCPDCREAKRFLRLHNIPYTEIDIETTPGAAQEVVANTGKRAIPQFVIDGKWVQPYQLGYGFLYEEMAQLLGIAESSETNGSTQKYVAPQGSHS